MNTIISKDKKEEKPKGKGTGTFYCPMHCEGDKTYDKPGDCPVCGMDLVEEQNLSTTTSEQWTCPMHPEVSKRRSRCLSYLWNGFSAYASQIFQQKKKPIKSY